MAIPTTGNVSDSPLEEALNSSTPLVWSHNHGSGSDGALYVGIFSKSGSEVQRTYTAVTRDGQSFTKVGQIDNTSGSQLSIWRLLNPNEGAADISAVTASGDTNDAYGVAVSAYGVNQTTPEDDTDFVIFPPANSSTGNVTTTVADCLLLFVLCSFPPEGWGSNELSLGAGQTSVIFANDDKGFDSVSVSKKDAASTGAHSCSGSWTDDWGPLSALIAVAPVAGGGGGSAVVQIIKKKKAAAWR